MNVPWKSYLESCGARFEANEPTHFGDLQAELSAAQNGMVIAPLGHVGVMRCNGEDAATFLHNLLTNDIKGLSRDRALVCGLCTAKGRMLADFLVWRDEDAYLLQLSADIQPAVQKKLSMYVLRSKVKITDASEALVLIGLSGPQAENLLGTLGLTVPQEPLGVSAIDAGQIIRLDAQRFVLALSEMAAQPLWECLSSHARPVGTAAWRWLDIVAGQPHITASTQEEFVPQMVNLELIGGVSFTKGCYPGQEIVARTKYLGKVKRRTLRAHVMADAIPAPGTDLYTPALPEQSSGKVVNAAAAPGGGYELLAELIMANIEGQEVRLGRADGPALEMRPLPYSLD